MSIALSMWNYRDWFRQKNIRHVFSIRNDDSLIYGVRFNTHQDADGNYALLSEAPADSEYQTVLSHGDNRIFFRDLSPFAVMNELSRMHAAIVNWEEQLLQINLTHGSLDSILSESAFLFDCPLTITFCDRLLAWAPAYEDASKQLWKQYLDLPLADLCKMLPQEASACRLYASPEPVIIHSPIYRGKQCLISNFLTANGKSFRITAYANQFPFSPGSLHLMRNLTEAVRTNIDLHDAHYTERHIDKHVFFLRCADASQQINQTTALQALHRFGWKCSDKYTVFEISLRPPSSTILTDKLYQVLRNIPSSRCIRSSRSVYLVCNCTADPADVFAEQIRKAIPSDRFVIAESNISSDFLSLPLLFQQAQQALQHALDTGVTFLAFPDIMTDYILRNLRENTSLEALIHPAVKRLKEEDQQHDTHYIETLNVWLHLARNYNAAAKKLGIHRNTMVNRIERIVSLTGIDLNDPQEQEAIVLSLVLSGC